MSIDILEELPNKLERENMQTLRMEITRSFEALADFNGLRAIISKQVYVFNYATSCSTNLIRVLILYDAVNSL
jgi:hypothetical protein